MASKPYDEAHAARDQLAADGVVPDSILDKPQADLSPEDAMTRLREGNERYQRGETRLGDFASGRVARAAGQAHFAALVSCADSRVAPELLFDQAPGALFVCRLAGNVVNADVLASLEFAVSFLGTRAIVVLGHASCGAVDAAIKVAHTGAVLPGHLDELALSLAPAVRAAEARCAHDDPKALLDCAIEENVRLSARRLMSRSPILASAVKVGKLSIAGGVL